VYPQGYEPGHLGVREKKKELWQKKAQLQHLNLK